MLTRYEIVNHGSDARAGGAITQDSLCVIRLAAFIERLADDNVVIDTAIIEGFHSAPAMAVLA